MDHRLGAALWFAVIPGGQVEAGISSAEEKERRPRIEIKRILPSVRGLELYYDFDEGKGKIVHDRSPKKNHIKLKSDAIWVQDGPVGMAVHLDKAAIVSEKKIGIVGSKPRTLAFFINVHELREANQCNLWLGWGPKKGKANNFYASSWGTGRLVWGWGWKMDWDLGSKVTLDQWHHVAITVDEKQRSKYYINGKLHRERPHFGYATVDSALEIGAGTTDAKFDEVVVYNRALSPREVRRLYEFLMEKGQRLRE